MGERIKELRQAKGMSQAELARAAGVPVGTLRGWEYGRRTPLLDAAARLAVALGVSIDVLAGLAQAESQSEPKQRRKRQ